MSFQKFKTDCSSVRGRHRFATTKIYADVTSKGSRVQFGYCLLRNGENSMNVCDNSIQAEGLCEFFRSLG